MKNYFSQASSTERNEYSVPQPLTGQFIPWSEVQGDDWSLRGFLGLIRRRRRAIAGVIVTVMAATVGWVFSQKPLYEGQFRLLVEPLNNDTRFQQLAPNNNNNLSQSNLDYESQIQVLKSPGLMTSIVKKLETLYPDINYGSLVSSLTINRLGETKIIEVRYQNDDSNKVKAVLDTISQAYLEYSLQQRQTRVRQGLRFVEQELKPMQQRVDRLQRALQDFRRKYYFIDPQAQTSEITQQTQALSARRLEVEQELAASRATLAHLQGEKGKLAALNNAPVYQQLIVQLRQLENEIAGRLAVYTQENPSVIALQQKRNNLLPLLRQEAERVLGVQLAAVVTQTQTLEVQSQELASAERKLSQKIEELPSLTRQYTQLQQNLQVANDSLNRFLATKETLRIEEAQTELPWELVQAPIKPEKSISPDIRRNLVLGFIVSMVLGIVIAQVVDKLDNTYHNPDDLKENIKLPLLGIIPFDKQLKNNKSYQSVKFLEALRVISTNIQLLNSDRPIRSIVISSAMADDGKSTVAFHLAQTAATMGQRVLLVDADLRQPKIHMLSKISNEWGLSNLINSNSPSNEAIHQLASTGGLSVITSGTVPPDSARLLSSQKMRELIQELEQGFDLVIYDAPPLIELVDVRLFAPHTDGIVLVVRMDETDRSVLKQSLDSLKISRISVLGIVANGYKGEFKGTGKKYQYRITPE